MATRFEPGAIYAAFNGAENVGYFTSAQAEKMSENPVYRGLQWQKTESKTLPIPDGVKTKRKAKDKPDKKTGTSNEANTEPSPADGPV